VVAVRCRRDGGRLGHVALFGYHAGSSHRLTAI
jgi:hypothetical protein